MTHFTVVNDTALTFNPVDDWWICVIQIIAVFVLGYCVTRGRT